MKKLGLVMGEWLVSGALVLGELLVGVVLVLGLAIGCGLLYGLLGGGVEVVQHLDSFWKQPRVSRFGHRTLSDHFQIGFVGWIGQAGIVLGALKGLGGALALRTAPARLAVAALAAGLAGGRAVLFFHLESADCLDGLLGQWGLLAGASVGVLLALKAQQPKGP
jgi:hypothetical protein